jgi:hypothetical protein
MPLAAIPGFIKKRSASQQYRRSPRQLTRDITVALEMRDETVLPHVCIRNEDGSVIEGTDITTDMVKELRAQGRNPMWYLRRTWLEQTYGLRGAGDQPEKGDPEFDDDDESAKPESPTTGDGPVTPDLVQLMQESIRELKQDKVMLTEQLKIKDEQIRETTERWKESNYISQGLNQRLEAMEKRFELNSRLLQDVAVRKPESVVPIPADNSIEAKPTPEESAAPPVNRKTNAKQKSTPVRKGNPATRPQKKQPQPKWYEMPTFKRLLSRNK